MILILPNWIAYLEPSYDPIFHATQQLERGGFSIWVRSSLRASILACVDRSEVCFGNHEQCWRSLADGTQWVWENVQDRLEAIRVLLLLFSALRHSDIISQLVDSEEEALRVRSRLSHSGVSMETGDWKRESEGFFQSSLAQLQNDVINIANGAFHDVSSTHNLLGVFNESLNWSGICDMVLVNAPGHKSVSLRGVITLLALSLLVIIISINLDNKLVVLRYLMRKAVQLKGLVEGLLVKAYFRFVALYLRFSYWRTSEGRIRLPTRNR